MRSIEAGEGSGNARPERRSDHERAVQEALDSPGQHQWARCEPRMQRVIAHVRAGGTPVHRLTPVWRVLPPDSLTLKKLSFDSTFIRHQREVEGLDTGPVAGRAAAQPRRASRRT